MGKSRIRESVEVTLIFLASFGLLETVASADTRWNTQPSWSAQEPSQTPHKALKREASYVNPNLSPFAPGSNNLALDLGQVFLMGDLGKNYNDSLGAQLHYTYGVSDIFGFDSSLGYSNHSNGKFSMTTALAGLRTNLTWYDKVVPYVVFGLGFYRPSYQIDPNASVSPMVFGVHLGPGISLEMTKQLFFGASLTFHDIFGTTTTTADGKLWDIGGTFTSFYLNVGVTF